MTTSFAVVLGAIVCFSGIQVSKAGDIDAKKLYMTHCKTCHGVDGKPTDLGVGLGAREFADAEWQAKTTDEQILNSITNGKKKMPRWSEKLKPEEMQALAKYVRKLAPKKRS